MTKAIPTTAVSAACAACAVPKVALAVALSADAVPKIDAVADAAPTEAIAAATAAQILSTTGR